MKPQALALCVGIIGAGIVGGQTTAAQEIHCSGPRIIRVTKTEKPELAPTALASVQFMIVLDFDANVPANFRTVIQHAADEWTGILLTRGVNPAQYHVDVRLGIPLHANALAETATCLDDDDSLDHAEIVIRPNLLVFNSVWYVDPNPADDTEFAQNPPAGHDLLSVVRHELGHALGWTGATDLPRIGNLVAGGVFDPDRLNIAVVDDASHADPEEHPEELMQPGIGPSTRRAIRLYPTAALPARAFQYVIPMRFVDPNYLGVPHGSASHPYRFVDVADQTAAPGIPILLAPVAHTIDSGTSLMFQREWFSARGGAMISTP